MGLAGGVGVGAQGEAGVVVAQHGGDGLDVYAVLEGQGGKGVAEIVEAVGVLRVVFVCLGQDDLMPPPEISVLYQNAF